MKKSYLGMLVLVLFVLISGFRDKEQAVRFVVVPDIQSFFKRNFDADPNQLYKVSEWIKAQENNIDFMIQVGDMTEDNDKESWKFIKDLFHSLDGEQAYTFALGNHDMGSKARKVADTRNTQMANKYLQVESMKGSGLVASYPNDKVDNLAHAVRLKAEDFLIISLEFGPRPQTVKWADAIIKEHPDHKVIINTHAYMYSDSTRIGDGDKWNPHTYGLNNDGDPIYDGEELWTNFVKKHKNIFMVVSGHILNGGIGTLVSEGDHGNKVCQMLANYQYGVHGMGNGLNGYIRIVDYYPVSNKIEVKTYSPILNEYLTDKANQFVIDMN